MIVLIIKVFFVALFLIKVINGIAQDSDNLNDSTKWNDTSNCNNVVITATVLILIKCSWL